MGRWGDGEVGRWGDGEVGKSQISYSDQAKLAFAIDQFEAESKMLNLKPKI